MRKPRPCLHDVIRWSILFLLLAFIFTCRFHTATGEWYATHLYPAVSLTLSRIASIVPFSLEELLAVGILIGCIIGVLLAHRRGRKVRFILIRLLETAAWLYVWFYIGWGANYFRASFYERLHVEPANYEEQAFRSFLQTYTDSLNASYIRIDSLDPISTQRLIQAQYRSLPTHYGLQAPQEWQMPKRLCFNRLYSGVGVLGFMGPFFSEMQLNEDLLPSQYPFTYAHELSHLLGISSEAEANYWAFRTCIQTDNPAIRYSGYIGLLPYVIINARATLPAEDYRLWALTIRQEVVREMGQRGEYWKERYSPFIGAIQDKVYDLFLKGNRVSTGKKNYAEVIQMVMSAGV